ncbi:hypothetical protein MTP03_19310 [Tsukamurella sp. PLM1]|nr:hypothetical protein MTP03_19310 [Tsukamurella sp. PLM1]
MLAASVLLLVVLGALGAGVGGALRSGGSTDPRAESARAQSVLEERFARGGSSLVLAVHADDSGAGPAVAEYGRALTERLTRDPAVQAAVSVWSDPAAVDRLTSADGAVTLIVASLRGGTGEAPHHARTIVDGLPAPPAGCGSRRAARQ